MKTLKEALSVSEALFSRKNLKLKGNPFGLTEDDLRGDIIDYPMGVVVRMLEEQELQSNIPDVKVFQNYWANDKLRRGFDWDQTEAGNDFWQYVLNKRNWKRFFEKYPEYEMYNLD